MEVYVASSAKEAWKVLDEEHIPVVISDQRMPECTGTEFFNELREKRPEVMRILLTGYTDFDDVIAAINEGNIYHYINKPWDREQLKNVIFKAYEVYELSARNKTLMQRLEAHNQELERRVKERTLALSKSNEALQQQNDKLEGVNTELQKLNEALAVQLESGQMGLGYEDGLAQELEQRQKELASYSLQLIHKNKVLNDLKTELKQVMQSGDSSVNKKFRSLVGLIDYSFSVEKEWSKFRQVFENVHQTFYSALDQKHPELTPSERKLAALFKLNLNSKEMADVLGISQDSLKTARHRLRKKLQVKGDDNLANYINSIR